VSGFCKWTERRAMAQHRCCSCWLGIRPGDAYTEMSGVSDGSWYRYRGHRGCLRAVDAEHRRSRSDEWDPDIGEVVSALGKAALPHVASERWAVRAMWSLSLRGDCLPWDDPTNRRVNEAIDYLRETDEQRCASYALRSAS